jgi:ParB-like chromosome segregation protein Spo0J
MKIEQIKVSDIKPYKRNNKIHSEKQINLVAESIKEFGFKNPVLLDKNNEIIAGHCRVTAAKKLKLEEVPCIYADDLTPAQVKAYRLADNKLAELAEWDFDNIKFELEELQLEGFDIDLTGFDMLDFEEEKEGEEDDFDVDEQLKKPVMSKLGDIWLLGQWVYCEKCGKKHNIT